jgi:hypothetical protein
MCVPNVFVCCTSGALLPVLLRIRTTPPFVHGSLWLLSSPQQAFTCQASGFVISLFVFHRADSTTQFVPPSLPVDSPPPPFAHGNCHLPQKSTAPRKSCSGKVKFGSSRNGPSRDLWGLSNGAWGITFHANIADLSKTLYVFFHPYPS